MQWRSDTFMFPIRFRWNSDCIPNCSNSRVTINSYNFSDFGLEWCFCCLPNEGDRAIFMNTNKARDTVKTRKKKNVIWWSTPSIVSSELRVLWSYFRRSAFVSAVHSSSRIYTQHPAFILSPSETITNFISTKHQLCLHTQYRTSELLFAQKQLQKHRT